MKITIKYFGMIEEIKNLTEEILEQSHPLTVKELKKLLELKYPKISTQQYQIAIDQTISEKEDEIIDKDIEIALLPSFAGG